MVALGWGLAQVERQRDAPPAFSGWGVWVGAGRWEALEAPPGCLDVSGVPGEPCLVKEAPWGKGRWQRRCWGIYESIVRPSSTLSLADYIAGRSGGGGRGWEGLGSRSHFCLQNLCILLTCSVSSYFESTFKAFLSYVLMISLGNMYY